METLAFSYTRDSFTMPFGLYYFYWPVYIGTIGFPTEAGVRRGEGDKINVPKAFVAFRDFESFRKAKRSGGFIWTMLKVCLGSPRGGSPPPRTPEKFSHFMKKSIKNYNFRPIFHKFNENFAIFTKFSCENLGKI